MGKLKSDMLKNAVAILLLVFFVMSATTVAVSAASPGSVTVGPIVTQTQVVTNVVPTVQTAVVVAPFSVGHTIVNLNNRVSVGNRLSQNSVTR